jgi:MerR family transcriptional regulator, heat shock protein HspR
MRVTEYQLVVVHPHRDLMAIEDVAAHAGVHLEIVRRFVEFGLIEPVDGLMFDPSTVHRVRVIQRLRCDLGVNLAGIGVILELLDRLGV